MNRFLPYLLIFGLGAWGLVACEESTGDAEQGEDCEAEGDCNTGFCAVFPGGDQYCSAECGPDNECTGGLECAQASNGDFLCVRGSTPPRTLDDAGSGMGGQGGEGGQGGGAGGEGGGAGGEGGGAGGEGGGAGGQGGEGGQGGGAGGEGGGAGGEGGQGGQGGGGGDGLSCLEINNCVNAAMCQDQACLDGCLDQGSADGQSQFNAIGACTARNMCQDQACVQQNCSAELMNCQGNANADVETCADIFTCFAGCGGDQGCAQACFMRAPPAAQGQYNAIAGCAQSNGCGGNDQACIEQNCGPELMACFGG